MRQSRIKPIHFLWLAFACHLVSCSMSVAFYIYVGHGISEISDAELKILPKKDAERARIQSESDIERLRSTTIRWFNIADDDSRYLASERDFIRQTSIYLVVSFTGSLTLLIVTIYAFYNQPNRDEPAVPTPPDAGRVA